ncbi:MAG: hypothetical protein WAV30_00475 [Microgenomates group bacterium]
MEKAKLVNKLRSEPLPIHSIDDKSLLSMIACNGFRNNFYLESLTKPKARMVNNDGAVGLDQTSSITSKENTPYKVHFITDRDNRGVILTDYTNQQVVTKVVLRDRHNDGTLEATPPKFLKMINGTPEEQIPARSREIGFTNWGYSNPGDKQKKDVRAVELSIVSADPNQALLERLIKKNRLFVNPVELAHFIDDPFAYIPFENASPQSIDTWWKYWFQVVDRGIRGKSIPQPGQTSQRGFEGFFKNAIEETKHAVKEAGYTHLSAVPTWTYVWHSFIENGFVPVDQAQAKETTEFFERIAAIQLPNGDSMSSLSPKHPLASWLSVAPFVLELNPDHIPCLGIDPVREERFQSTYKALKDAVQSGDTIKTYPLAPGRNLWLQIAV